MKNVQITFYGGIDTVGGNKFLVEDGETRFFFDFGTDYAAAGRYFEEFLQPRSARGLLDPLEMGLLPPLEGVYRPELEATDETWPRFQAGSRPGGGRPGGMAYRDLRQVQIDGVLLSHAHQDHAGHISYLRGDIPIHCSAMSACILKANQDCARGLLEGDVCYLKPRAAEDGVLKAKTRGKDRQPFRKRPFALTTVPADEAAFAGFWDALPSGEVAAGQPISGPMRVGSLPYRLYPLDHSLMGACAYAVETSAGWLVYSGDIRKHGRRKQQTLDFVQEASLLRPAIFLCEGTNAGRAGQVTEEEVHENCLKAVQGAAGQLVVADFGPRNIERLIIFLEIARTAGRKLVILPKDAYLLDAMRLASSDIPGVNDTDDTVLYHKPKARLDGWEKAVLERSRRQVGPLEVRAHPEGYLLCFSFWDINNLVDINPSGGLYIYSSSEAFTEEMEIDMERLKAWLEHFNIKGVGLRTRSAEGPEAERGFHSSGHASGPDLLEIVQAISPRTLVPIHTTNHAYFVENLGRTSTQVLLASQGQTLSFT